MILTSPARPIRSHLLEQGPVEVPFHNLLTTWRIDEPTPLDRRQILVDLAEAGISVNRPLTELGPDDPVTLSLDDDLPVALGLPVRQQVAAVPPAPVRPARWRRRTLSLSD